MRKPRDPMPREILSRHLEKLKRQNGSYSLRALARRIGVSHSFVSRILSGRSAVPASLLDRLIEALKIDQIDAAGLRASVEGKEGGKGQAARALGLDTTSYASAPESHLRVLRKWWGVALLDLATCEKLGEINRARAASLLGIDRKEANASIDELIELGLMQENEGGVLSKTEARLRLPTRGPNAHVRKFYEQTLALAKRTLADDSASGFERRLVMAFSCSANANRIADAKAALAAGLRRCAETLADGPGDDVFFVQGQMFSALSNLSDRSG